MLNTKLVTWALGIWTSITFVVCVIYGPITTESLHMSAFLEQVLPAFKWLTWWSFVFGLIESFFYGAYAGPRVLSCLQLAASALGREMTNRTRIEL